MKLLSLFILVTMVTASASTYSQATKFSMELDNASVKDVFQYIEKNSEFIILYNEKFLDVNRQVSVIAFEETVESILNQLFSGTDNTFKIYDRQVVILKKPVYYSPVVEKHVILNEIIHQPEKTITGTVTDDRGLPLPGVSILVKGTFIGTITDLDGKFTLSVPPDTEKLIFSFMGMQTQEINIAGLTSVNVVLEEDVIGLEELVVVGYATQRRINLTGSLTIVKADDLKQVAMPTIAQGLMGRSPGVFIKNKDGQPGDEQIDINIRGFGSPLIIVDGSPVSLSYFQQLQAADIESFNVLKDASAAAVYGARAGNGVILVETKRGVESTPKFSYSGDLGQQFFTVIPKLVNSEQYASMYNVALMNEGLDPVWTLEEIQKFRDGSDPDNYPDTDWWAETFKNYAPQHQHNLNVRGGTDRVKYYTAVGYFGQKGMHLSDDTDFKRFSLRSNIDVKLSEKFDIGFDLSLTNQDFLGPSSRIGRFEGRLGPMIRIWRSRPFAANKPLPDPTKVPAMLGGLTVNPYYLGFIQHVGFHEWNTTYGFGKLKFQYTLPYGFKVRANFDMNRTYNQEKTRVLKMPDYDYDPETGEYILRRLLNAFDFLEEESRITKNLNQQYFLTWDKSLGHHEFSALLVHELLSDRYDYFSAYRRDYEFPIDYLFAGPDENKDNTGFRREGGRKAYIGRFNYNYQGKYLFEFSGRADGSPKFPPDKRWGYFPSASVGWRISEESFIRDNLPIISNLKIRASHGMLGFDAAGAFQYLSTYSIRSQYIRDSGVLPGVRADALPNTNITWEKMTISNLGIDFNIGGFLDGTLDYFYRLRSDVLGTRIRDIPNVVGATLPQENYYKFDNRGLEFSLYYRKNSGELKYNLGGNISTNREKTVFRDQGTFATMEAFRTGNQNDEWTDRFWAYPTDGLFQSQEEIENWADIDGQGNRTIKPGDIKYVDYNEDGRISAEDMIIAGRGVMPRLMYGIDVSLSWKGFDFMMLWQGAGMYNFNLRPNSNFHQPFFAENSPLVYMYHNNYTPENPWMPANTTNAKWPRYQTDRANRSHRNYNLNNEFWLVNGGYIRLKNIQLGYSIPQKPIQSLGIDNLKIYVGGYDLLLFTAYDYDFVDPEINTSGVFSDYHPITATFNFGVQITF